ncbi:MAG: TonB-dependent receptor, partial [Bacteroidota bacterium]|nr:TonB-dependent receptor [Bacteroidota bacterium]
RSTAILIWNDIDSGLYRPKPGTVTRTIGAQYYIDPFINFRSKAGTKHALRTRLHHQDFENDNDQSNSNTVMHAEYQAQHTIDLFGETTLTGGLVYRNTESTALLYAGDADGDGVNSALNTAGYLQLDKRLFEKISISAGIRYECFAVNDDEASQPVFRAGANWQIFKATYLRASYGQGFRFPTIGERFINTNVGSLRIYPNNDLRPETSVNIEGGIKQGFKIGGFQGFVDAVVFQQDYTDYVEFTFGRWLNSTSLDDAFGFGFRSINTGSARVTGTEFELAGKGSIGPIEIATLIGYTYTLPITTTPDYIYGNSSVPGAEQITYNNSSYDPTDKILKFRIQQLFRSDIQFEYKRIFTGASVRYNSHVRNLDKIFVDLDDPDSPFPLTTGVGEWMRTHRIGDTVIDVRLGFELSEKTKITFIINNLTNLEYAIRPLAIEAPRNMQLQLIVDL